MSSMSGVLAPLRKTAEKVSDKIGAHKGTAAYDFATLANGPLLSTGDKDGDQIRDPLDIFGASAESAEADALAEAAAIQAAMPGPTPIPDEEEIRRKKRNTAARRRSSGRASTFLTDSAYGDALGG